MDTEGELVDHSKFQMDGVFVKLEVERGKETSRNTFFSQHDIAFFTQSTQTAASMDQTCQCHFIALVEQSYAERDERTTQKLSVLIVCLVWSVHTPRQGPGYRTGSPRRAGKRLPGVPPSPPPN